MHLVRTDHPTVVEWRSPARGRWVATGPTGLVGIIERIDGRYVAVNGTGHELGKFRALDAAQSAVDPDPSVRREHRLEFAAGTVAIVAAASAVLSVWGMLR